MHSLCVLLDDFQSIERLSSLVFSSHIGEVDCFTVDCMMCAASSVIHSPAYLMRMLRDHFCQMYAYCSLMFIRTQ